MKAGLGSLGSRLVPADLSRESGKKALFFFYQSLTSDSSRRRVISTEGPVAWTEESGHINVQGGSGVNRPDREKARELSPSML